MYTKTTSMDKIPVTDCNWNHFLYQTLESIINMKYHTLDER